MAKKEKKTSSTKTGAKKVTAKSVICEGIMAGKTVPAILKTITAKVPESKADASHVGYYANALLKSGDIKESVREKYVKSKGRPVDKKVKTKTEKKSKSAKTEKKSKSAKTEKKSKSAKTEKTKGKKASKKN